MFLLNACVVVCAQIHSERRTSWNWLFTSIKKKFPRKVINGHRHFVWSCNSFHSAFTKVLQWSRFSASSILSSSLNLGLLSRFPLGTSNVYVIFFLVVFYFFLFGSLVLLTIHRPRTIHVRFTLFGLWKILRVKCIVQVVWVRVLFPMSIRDWDRNH